VEDDDRERFERFWKWSEALDEKLDEFSGKLDGIADMGGKILAKVESIEELVVRPSFSSSGLSPSLESQ